MQIKNNLFKKGFTLIETMTTIFIFSLLALGGTALMKDVFTNTQQTQVSLASADRARLIAFNFTNELRSASVGVDGSYPITQASNGQIIFYSNYGNSTGAINKIRYYISGTDLKKGVIKPSGSPLGYATSSETLITLGTGINNGATPLFYYYDGNYTGSSTPLTQPVNVNAVKFVKINMVILKQSTKNSTSTFIVDAGSTIRNLKNNLGN